MLRQIQEIQSLATKYSKAQLGQMVQMGLIDPQKAMMAGMMIQRIEQQNAQPPQTTVAQDIFGMQPAQNQMQQPPAQGQPPMAPPQGGMPPPQGGMPPPQMPPEAAPQGMADGGIANLYAGDVGNYADGGIVAFADRGAVKVDPDWGDLPRGAQESSKIKVKDKSFLDKIKEFHLNQPDEKGRVENPLNFGLGKGVWKGTYATPYDKDIIDAAKEAGVDPRVYWRLLYTESKFDPKAESYKGKRFGYGIAQISHHHGIPEEDLEDPKHSIKAGAHILKRFLNRAKGDYRKGLQGYKGAVSEAGIAAMTPHIDKVLGDSNLAPPPKKKKMPKLKPGQVSLHPVPVDTGMQVVRTGGTPTASEIAAAKAPRRASATGAEDVYDIGSGNFITRGWDTSEPIRLDEYYQEGAPNYGGWFTRDQLEGLPELQSGGYAGGGITSLVGGRVPRYAGEGPSQVTSSPSIFPSGSLIGMIQNNTLPGQESDAMRLNREIQNIERQLAQPNLHPQRRKELENVRNVIIQRVSQSYPSEGARGSATFTRPDALPPIASPVQQEAAAAEKSLPPVEVTAPRITAGASPSLRQGAPSGQGTVGGSAFGLPGIDSYRKKIDLKPELAPIPEKGDAEKELESTRALRKKAGYDEDFYNNMIAKIEERKGDRATEKDKAIGEAIMMAGFKLMGARRGQEFQNLSEGAQEGLMSYQKSMRDYQNRIDKLDERTDAYRLADSEARRTGADSAIAAAQKQNELRQKAEEKAAEAKNTMTTNAAQFAINLRDTDARLLSQAMANKTSKEVAQIHAASGSGYGEAERLLGQYQEIARVKGKPAADAWLADLERIRGAGKPQNFFSFEEALKIVANNPVNMGLNPQQLAQKARELVQAQQSGGVSAPAGAVDKNNPLLK